MWKKVRTVLLVLLIFTAGIFWFNRTAADRREAVTASVNRAYETTALDAAEASKEIRRVAVTFDDGPDPVWTKRLLDGLKERGVQATFFLIGEKIEGNEALLQRMQEEGHLIGNHSYSHVELNRLTESAAQQEIEKTNQAICDATGQRPEYIRPPYGAWEKKKDCPGELMTVYWTLDTMDWSLLDTEKVMQRVRGQVKDGDIILFHDIYETSVEAALQTVDDLLEQGYDLVTVDELILD